MKCKFCGTEVEEKQRFCPNCGLLLNLSFTPFSVKDLQRNEEKTEEPEFLRQAMEYQEELALEDTEEQDSDMEESAEQDLGSEESIEQDFELENSEEDLILESSLSEVEHESDEAKIEYEDEVFAEAEEILAENTEEILTEEALQDKSSDTEEAEIETESIDQEDLELESKEQNVEEEPESDEEFKERPEEPESDEEFEEEPGEPESNEEFEGEPESSEEFEEESEETVAEEEIAVEREAEETVEEEASDALIYHIRDKKEEEFFGEIPNDPDNFREKSNVPPTSMKELKASMPSKKIVLATAAVAILGFSGINYLNSSKVRYDSFLKKGEKLIQAKQYSEARDSLEKDKGSFQVDERYYLLLADALSKDGKHEEAVSCLMEAANHFPENEEIQNNLKAMDPKVSSNITEDLYHDSLEISLESNSDKIIYSLSGGKEEIEQKEYSAPVTVRRNGKYSLMAYAIASDGAKGELYIKEFTVDLDKEKYHLSSFVDTDQGKVYIDENGDQAVGWRLIQGVYYYFDENGLMQTGFLDLDGERYYLDDDGKMHTGRLDLEGKSYYFDEQGHMIRDAWIENRYYVDENGEMLKNQENSEGIYFDENGNRSFNAESLYKDHPDSILAIVSKDRKTEGNNYYFTAKVYYQKKKGRPSGDMAYETEIILSQSALMRYLDEDLPTITAKDAVSFLPNLYLQEIVQNKDGVITGFSFVLGERRS